MKRKKATALPRLTVLAMSRKELVAFVQAVEDLRHVKAELAELVEQLGKVAKGRGRKPAAAPIPPNTAAPEFMPYPEGSANGEA